MMLSRTLLARVGVEGSPLSGNFVGLGGLAFPDGGDFIVERVIGVRNAEKGLNGEKNRADEEGGTPFVLQDVETNSPCS